MKSPYSEVSLTPNIIYRTFKHTVDPSTLVWHRDKKDRYVIVIEGRDWKFQIDNELPLELEEGTRIFIPREQIHRVHKGTTDLVIRIEEF